MNSKSKLLAPELVNAERPVWAFSKKIFCEGMRDGVPIALGYFAVSFSLGIAARRAGFTPFQGFLVSLRTTLRQASTLHLPSSWPMRPIWKWLSSH